MNTLVGRYSAWDRPNTFRAQRPSEAAGLLRICEASGVEIGASTKAALARLAANEGAAYVEIPPAEAEKLSKLAVPKAMDALHAAYPNEERALEIMGAGREYFSELGLSEEEAERLLADEPLCKALARIFLRGASNPASLTAALFDVEHQSFSAAKLIEKNALPSGAKRSEAVENFLRFIPENPGAKYGTSESSFESIKTCLFALSAPEPYRQEARAALLAASSTFENGAPAKDPWAGIDQLGDFPPDRRRFESGQRRAAGAAERGDAARSLLANLDQIATWRNPSRLLRAVPTLSKNSIGFIEREAQAFSGQASKSLAVALREFAKNLKNGKEVCAAFAERLAEGFQNLPPEPSDDDLLPNFQFADGAASMKWRAADFQGDPMAKVAMAAASSIGFDAENPIGLVGEAKRHLSGMPTPLTPAAWKALAGNPQLAALFANAVSASSQHGRPDAKRKTAQRLAENIMQAADASGSSTKTTLQNMEARSANSSPMESAANILSSGARMGIPQEDQAELIKMASGPGTERLRSFLSGSIPCVPEDLGISGGAFREAASSIPLLSEDRQAIVEIAPAFLKSLSARMAKHKKQFAEAADARAATLREFEDIIDVAHSMPPGFWSQLDRKDPFAHAKRVHREWVDTLALKKLDKADNGIAWRSLVDSDSLGQIRAVELTTARQLFEEGKAMRHCVVSYAPQCRSGTSRIISITRNGARLATLELGPVDSKGSRLAEVDFESVESRSKVRSWKIFQNRGPCNAAISNPEALELARLIEERASEAFAKHTRHMEAKRLSEKLKKKEAEGANPAPKGQLSKPQI